MVVRHRTKSEKKFGDSNRTGLRHRGAGNRGGVGKAGHGKRSKQKKSMYMVNGKVDYGQKGFKSKIKPVKAIDVGYICEHIDALCEKKGAKFAVNIKKLGYGKVLGAGVVDKPLIISECGLITEKARAKITKAGGEVVEG
ncbi:50S ribosomal protein L15 [Candidatus Tiddalikarchaeum anstoanum]|nr:50S ribosomal protein L15 [Candidatus Tiddalikarchaeum anstoanum]